jgi:sortase (surface protein transpeptidase)
MDNFKKISKYFLFLFIFFLLIFNWSKVSWLFNYQAVSGFLSKAVPQNDSREKSAEDNPAGEYFEGENKLVIPKLEVTAPLLLANDSDPEVMLEYGTVIFPDSVLPGESGQTIILGHSAPPGWPKIKYEWVFSRLEELSAGDEVQIFFDNRKYLYSIEKQIILDAGEDLGKLLNN